MQRWFEVHHRMLAWTDGRRVRMQVARDITERRNHEEASRVQQEKIQLTSRLTTMGEMASSLAHELNQPLTAISNYSMGAVALVKAGHTSPSMLLPALEKAAAQAERAGKIISRIREFVKRSEPRRQRGRDPPASSTTPSASPRSTRASAASASSSFVPSNAPDVLADPILIEQVLLNLLKNGLEAMEKSESDELKVCRDPARAAHRSGRGGPRPRPRRARAPVRAVLQHQDPGSGHGAEHLPYHYRVPSRPPLGGPQSRRRHDLQVHPAVRRSPERRRQQ